jgi:hypothetical protein
MAYRLYYRLDQWDPTFPPAQLQKELSYPLEKPVNYYNGKIERPVVSFVPAHFPALPTCNLPPAPAPLPPLPAAATVLVPSPPPTTNDNKAATTNMETNDDTNKIAAEDRRKILAEVREHLDILKEFEGAISPEDLAERKRQLFLALPPAPPAVASYKKART